MREHAYSSAAERGKRKVQVPTISIEFHSLLRILLTSPVRIIWLAAEICGLRLRAKIMKAFMGRLGVPSALRVWDVSAWYGSSGGRGSRRAGAAAEGAGDRDMIVSDECEWGRDAGRRTGKR